MVLLACSAAFAMTSFSSLPWATKLQVFIPASEHFSSFAMSDLLRRDVLRLRASSRVGSTESKFREHESRRFAEMCQRGHLFPMCVMVSPIRRPLEDGQSYAPPTSMPTIAS